MCAVESSTFRFCLTVPFPRLALSDSSSDGWGCMPSGNGGATEPHRTPDPKLKFHHDLSLPMDSSHPLPFSCIHFHLSPMDQSDFSWALMPLSTTLLLGGHPSFPQSSPMAQPQASRLQGKRLSYLPCHRGWRRIRRLEGGTLTDLLPSLHQFI